MEMLAHSIPYNVVSRHCSDLLQIESLLFGQAGMLKSNNPSGYEWRLQQEYNVLRKKYALTPLSETIWNYGKVRPSNSPIIRLAQLALVLSRAKHLTSSLLHLEQQGLVKLLTSETHPYWKSHKRFGMSRKIELSTVMGKDSILRILINVVARLRFAHGKYNNNLARMNDAITLLQSLPAEQNSVTDNWQKQGVQIQHAADSQAMLQLYHVYCTQERCFECPIGIKLLQTETHETDTQPA